MSINNVDEVLYINGEIVIDFSAHHESRIDYFCPESVELICTNLYSSKIL